MKHLRPWVFLCLSLILQDCRAQHTEKDPCDPPPPCLDPMEQPFGIGLLRGKSHRADPGEAPPVQAFASPDRDPGDDLITVYALPGGDGFRLEFRAPQRLHWETPDVFRFYLMEADNGRIDTLRARVAQIRVDCCPQLTITELSLNGRPLCRACHQKQPVRLR